MYYINFLKIVPQENKMIILTGAAGFIGSVLLYYLNKNGINDIICVDRLGCGDKWKNLIGKQFVELIDYDIFFKQYNKLLNDVEMIIHLGACVSTTEQDMDYLLNINYRYTKEIFNLCQKNKIRFLYASSASTYGNGKQGFSETNLQLEPLNKYGYSKHLFDIWWQRHPTSNQCVGLKFFNVYGPNEYHKGKMSSLIYQFYQQIVKNATITIYGNDGLQSRDFVYVKDAVDVMLYFIFHSEISGIYNVGSGQDTEFNTIAKLVIEMGKRPAKIEYTPIPDNLSSGYQKITRANLNKLREVGYQKNFTSIKEGIHDYITQYLLKHKYL